MKKINLIAVPLFVAALVVGAFAVGPWTQAQATPVSCSLNANPIPVGSSVTFTASGGTGTYLWSSPNFAIANSSAASLSLTFIVPGNYPVTVTSGNTSATCNLVVNATEAPSPVPSPGFPNTGELPA